ncbi:MAG: sigma-70 family RNA polymerase sigma factor [Sphingobacteriales bacterium]|nr:MAG: sigma-70 family RNA polymerase sigma factor [Sphingobacteriales bacterium]
MRKPVTSALFITLTNEQTIMILSTKKTYSDEELIRGILEGGKAEDSCLKYLYKLHFPSIVKYVTTNNGSREEAKDVFHDALTAFYEQIKSGKFKGESNTGTYLNAIARNMWLNRLKRDSYRMAYEKSIADEGEQVEEHAHEAMVTHEKSNIILSVLSLIGEECKRILLLSIYESLPMEEIAELMGFKNAQNARNKKLKCSNHLKELLTERPQIRQLLSEFRFA